MLKAFLIVPAAFLVLGSFSCGSNGEETQVGPNKSDIRGGKADSAVDYCLYFGYESGCDLCEEFGWYGDGICDQDLIDAGWCVGPDPDCGPVDPDDCQRGHECDELGATLCAEGLVYTCETDDEDGCRVWRGPDPCAIGYCLDAETCRDPADFQTSAFYPDLNGGMLAVRGNELSGRHHTGSFFTTLGYSTADGCALPTRPIDLPSWIPGTVDFWYPFAYANDTSLQDGLGMVYHPGRYNMDLDWYLALFDYRREYMVGMEIFNAGDRYNLATSNSTGLPRGRWHDHRALWDYINASRDHDDLIWGFSNSDFHGAALSGTAGLLNANRHYMKRLDEGTFRENLRSGAFTASYYPSSSGIGDAPVLTGIDITATTITLSCAGCSDVLWYGNKSLDSGLFENPRHPDYDSNNPETQLFLMYTSEPYSGETSLTIDLDDHFVAGETNFVRAVLINSSGQTYVQPFGFVAADTSGYLVANPYAAVDFGAVEIFKSNLHTHTAQSDGSGTVPNVITFYADAGYHILSITDHDNVRPRGGAYPYAGRDGTGPNGDQPACGTTWPWNEWFEHHADANLWSGDWLYTGPIPQPSLINWWLD